jgi:molybdopterin synthase sulfur carrier subunit
MPVVYLPAGLGPVVGGAREVDVPGETVGSVIDALERRFPGLVGKLREGDGLVAGLAVAVDGAFVSRGLLAPVRPESEVHFLPALGGG